MTKQQLIETVATTTERSKGDVETIVDSLLGEIGKALKSGERVDFRGFGSFTVKDKKARQGRNPKTGETIQIAAKRAATFKPSKELSDRLAPDNAATTS
jgi:integration host factor subunit beta